MEAPDEVVVAWRGNEVGRLREVVSDQWYVDGIWHGAGTAHADGFESFSRRLKPREVLGSPALGTRVLLDNSAHALVLSFAEGRLLLRRVVDHEAVAWLLEHVS